MNTLSAVILVKNEEKNIQRCIESLDFADEIIIIDDFSVDKTLQIARKYKTKILNRQLNDNFASQRNFGLKKATCEWVLFIDADEIVTAELKSEIIKNVNDTTYKAFYLQRRDVFMGKTMRAGEWGKKKLLRLAKKDSGVWTRAVHEYWDVNEKAGLLHSPLLHFPHATLSEFIGSIDFYSTLHSSEHNKVGVKPNLIKIVVYPALKFIDNFFVRGGFRDGVYGFVFSVMMSFHSFLAWSKLYIKKSAKK